MQRRAPRPRTRPRRRIGRPAVVVALLASLTVGGFAASSPGAGAALATVGNGLATTDLAAPGNSATAVASALVGPGVTVSNVTYSGDAAQTGLIHLVDPAVVSFNDGVIMSSGNIADVVGPNKSESTTGDMAGPADPQLTALIANTQTVNPMTYDAASLEFDFVPTASQVYFTYTFGSDEYLEWVNLFNDVFAFYVNGTNCATVPSGDPVSIDTINSTVNPQLYRDNSFWSPPANPINIEPDGLSVEMICSAPVTAGQVNHLKLAIADTSDQILDSVVMIKAHSLSTTKPESCNDGHDNDDDLLVDMDDDSCASTTTPPPAGGSGIGSGSSAPPFTGNEGTPIPLDAAALDWTAPGETTSVVWTVEGINGTTATCDVTPAGNIPMGPGGAIPVAYATCPDEGEYVAKVEGWDAEGGSSFDKDVDFFVHNAPPAVSIDTPTIGSATEVGTAVQLLASVVDPGAGDAVSCDLDWGDGTVETVDPVDGACSGEHTYATTGTQVVSVTATDGAGDSAAAATVVSVGVAGLSVSSSANPAVKGQPVTLTGTTTLGTTGTMTFSTGTTVLGSRSVSGGSASLTTSALTVGTHAITVTYKKSSTATPVTSSALTQVIDPGATTTGLTSSANPSVNGQAVSLKATVAPVAPAAGGVSGMVTFLDDGVVVGTKSLSGGAASLTVRPTAGTHHYSATFDGSASFLGSATAADIAQQVDPAATTTVLTSSANPSVSGQAISVKAVVKAVAPGGGTPAGTVDLYDGEVLVASKAQTNGSASFSLRPTIGTHSFTAVFDATATHLGSSSAPLTQAVDPTATTTVLTSSANPSVSGQPVTVKAVVKAVAPGSGVATGTVDLYEGEALVASKSLVNGSAGFVLTPTVGAHTYTAVYGGSGTHLASAATALVQQVSPATAKVAVSSTYATTTAGHSGSLVAGVSAVSPGRGVPTGTAEFRDGDTVLATVALFNGKASLPLATLSVGVHQITVAYSGDGAFSPASSPTPFVQTIT